MTLADVKAMKRAWLSVTQVASVLGCDPQGIRVAAHKAPERLGFPVMVLGRNGRGIKIPRLPFIRFMEEGK